ncbi:MAG: hypothetical protein MUC36_12530 [Planctomycetes bacterium]|jgi:hypothetical protein|nr:hypothetical protein [Planctomycetota bacterium]
MILACFVSLLSSVLAAPPQAPAEPLTSFLLRSQQTIHGRAVAIEGDWVVLDVVFLDGSATIRRQLDDFGPVSQLRIHQQVTPPITFEDHLAMARRAIALEVLPQAGEHAGIARRLAAADPTGAQTATLDTWAAATLTVLFDTAIRGGDVMAARHYLRLIATRVPDRFDEKRIGEMFDQIAAADTLRRKTTRAVTAAAAVSKQRGKFELAMQPVQKQVERADALVRAGLGNARHTVQSTHSYEQALVAYRSAWVDLQAILKTAGTAAEDQQDAAELVQRIKDSALQAMLHAGNAMAVQGDYRSALAWASKGLLLDADSEDAKALVRTIQIAQSSGGPWGGWAR